MLRTSEDRLYQWHRRNPQGIYEIDIDLEPGQPWVELGAAKEIVYQSDKWDYEKKFYEHKFAPGYPRLLAHPTDDALLIVGGKFQITKRGLLR